MPTQIDRIPLWRYGEFTFTASQHYENPLQDAKLEFVITSPSGKPHPIDGFWDGGQTWRARFMPHHEGKWTWETKCSNANDSGLHGQRGEFMCTPAVDETRFDRHGAIVSHDHRYLAHKDGTPFFWLADTVLMVRCFPHLTNGRRISTHWRAKV